MFKLLFSSIAGGGPYEWAALALGVVLALGGSFAGGALWEAGRLVKVEANAAPAAAKVQHDHDVQVHTDAVKADAPIKQADQERDKRLDAILLALASKPAPQPSPDPQKNCVMPRDVVQLLNDAGH